jgi:Dna[CI] antecedent, DciA
MAARKISEILGAENALGNLAAATHRVEQLQRIYVEAVPAALSRTSRVGWARAGVVSVIANNGAVAAKLRQLQPRILAGFKRHGLEFNSMRIEVQVDAARVEPGGRAPKLLTRKAMAAIEEALQSVPQSPLRDALRRLARRRAS